MQRRVNFSSPEISPELGAVPLPDAVGLDALKAFTPCYSAAWLFSSGENGAE